MEDSYGSFGPGGEGVTVPFSIEQPRPKTRPAVVIGRTLAALALVAMGVMVVQSNRTLAPDASPEAALSKHDGPMPKSMAANSPPPNAPPVSPGRESPPEAAASPATAKPNERNGDSKVTHNDLPHVVFLMVDDQGFNDVGYASADLSWATPNIDALAAGGVKLGRYYTLHLCTPARSTLMTGKYPIHTGMLHDVIQPTAAWGLPLEHKLMPQYMHELGYVTHMVGKWHLGFYNESFLPTERGFETYLGYLGDQEHYKTHIYDRNLGCADHNYNYDFIETNSDGDFELMGHNPQFVEISSATVFSSQARSIFDLTTTQDKPLFLYLAWQHVHGPLDEVDETFWTENNATYEKEMMTHIPQLERRRFAALTVQLDRAIQDVYEYSRATLGTNTYFLYASDNGGCKDEGGYNTPLRGGKHYLFEGGVRVHGWLHGPNLNAVAGTTYSGIFHVSDWLPTITSLVKSHVTKIVSENPDRRREFLQQEEFSLPNDLDGVNQWDYISTASTHSFPRTELILNIDRWATSTDNLAIHPLNFTRGALIVGDWKFIANEYEMSWYSPQHLDSSESRRLSNSSSKISDCGYSGGTINSYLFNLTADPREENNLVDQEPEVASQLRGILDNMEIDDPAWQREMTETACSVFVKNKDHYVPWCDVDCDTK